MKKIIFLVLLVFFALTPAYSADAKAKLILFISEQNIEGPQNAWWASEVDLSSTEAVLAEKLINQGYTVIDPSSMNKIIKANPAFRMVDISESSAVKLGDLSQADYVVLGKAVASSGGNVPQSRMRSCFANITVKLMRIKDSKVIAYLDASGSSAHMDVITGGKEALTSAAEGLATRIVDALKNRGEM
jgi:hypothetical protein